MNTKIDAIDAKIKKKIIRVICVESHFNFVFAYRKEMVKITQPMSMLPDNLPRIQSIIQRKSQKIDIFGRKMAKM